MKKLSMLILAMAATFALQAQWVNNPARNNFIANCSEYGGEVYLSTDKATGDTYVQWSSSFSNGYSPSLQRLTFDGTPQWGTEGIRITSHTFSSSSDGYAMAATADKAVVSCFANYDGQTIAVKINANGTFAWGEQGIVLFDGQGFSRTELLAGDDGGVWALGFDYQRHYMQYIKADGSLYPTITIAANGYYVEFGKMTLGIDNSVFLSYKKAGNGFYADQEIYVVGYTKEGTRIGPEVQLMATQNFLTTYIHHEVPDGLGGAYIYIWHAGIGNAFNTYVFHYDANGFNTFSNPDGISVHSMDPSNYYLDANATVDPVSHDLIIAYITENAVFQSDNRIFINRITTEGERVWDEGIMVADYEGSPYGNLRVDAFEDGSGFSLVYEKSIAENNFNSTVEAIGLDMEGNVLWNKTLSSNAYNRSFCKNSTGFNMGQNIVAWVNSNNGGLYGQNFGTDGTMGPIEPVIPVPTCYAPENFKGAYDYDDETQTWGVQLIWTAPADAEPLGYNLYMVDPTGCETTLFLGPEITEYYVETSAIGTMSFMLTAVYSDCESDNALTPEGEDHVTIEVTGIPENNDDEIVTVTNIYNAKGQAITVKSLEELSTGLYIIQGMTKDGQTVNKKIVVNR